MALAAVSPGNQKLMAETALRLGLSVPALVQQVKALASNPTVYAAYPRACRVIIERIAADGEARSLKGEP